MKKIHTDIMIHAPKDKVWQILSDFRAYPEWNPFIKKIEGQMKEGSRLAVDLQPEGKSPMKFTPDVTEVKEGKRFEWLGSLFFKGLFDGRHFFELEVVDEHKTRFIHGEQFKGILSGLIFKMVGDSTKASFSSMNEALKARAEA